MVLVLSIGVIVGSVVAAFLWFASAVPNLPERMTVGWGGTGGSQDKLLAALKVQAWRSKLAAGAAGIAAFCQAGLTWIMLWR